MKLRFYGRLADAIGREIELDVLDGSSVANLRERLAADHPGAADVIRSSRSRAFVGDALVPDDFRVEPTQTIEFLPPVSGG